MVYHNRGIINIENENFTEAYLDFQKAKELGDEEADKIIEYICEVMGYNV